MARINTVFVYGPDPRYYVTREVAGRRRWFRLWMDSHVEGSTTTADMDELVALVAGQGLDPAALREPTDEERRPRA